MSIKPKMKMKKPISRLHKRFSEHINGASVSEFEKNANGFISKGDVSNKNPSDVILIQSTKAVIPSDADKSVAHNPNDKLSEPRKDKSTKIYNPNTPDVKSQLKSKTQSNKKTLNEVIDVTESSPSQSVDSSLSQSLDSSKWQSLDSDSDPIITGSKKAIDLSIYSPTKKKGSSTSRKSSISEVIDLCVSTDDSTVEQEEPSAFDDEEEHNVWDSIICLPKLLDCSNLSIPEPTNLTSEEQNSESKDEIGVMDPALPYPEDDPKSSSDYAKTPPIQPFDTTAMTPPLARESYDEVTASNEWDNSFKSSEVSSIQEAKMKNSTPLLAPEQDRGVEKCSNILTSPPDKDGGTVVSGTLNPDLQIPSYKKEAIPSTNPSNEPKDGDSQIRVSKATPMDTDAPSAISRKRMAVDAEARPEKSKRARVSENGQQYDIRFIVVECVKKCIQEVNSKLDRSRFKILCRTVSKRLLGSWSSRTQVRQKSIERWLKHRHVKIVRLVEKYLEKNLI